MKKINRIAKQMFTALLAAAMIMVAMPAETFAEEISAQEIPEEDTAEGGTEEEFLGKAGHTSRMRTPPIR